MSRQRRKPTRRRKDRTVAINLPPHDPQDGRNLPDYSPPAPDEPYFIGIDFAAPGSTDWSSEAPIHWQNSSCPKPALCLCIILAAAAIFIFLFLFLLTSA